MLCDDNVSVQVLSHSLNVMISYTVFKSKQHILCITLVERSVLSITHRGRKTNNWEIKETSHRCDQMYPEMAENHQQIMRQTETSHVTAW